MGSSTVYSIGIVLRKKSCNIFTELCRVLSLGHPLPSSLNFKKKLPQFRCSEVSPIVYTTQPQRLLGKGKCILGSAIKDESGRGINKDAVVGNP